MTATVGELLAGARRRLVAAPFRPSTREAALLLGHVLGWSEARVLARDELAVEAADADRFSALLERRLDGEPVAYLTGEREFFGRVFRVDRRVLIPRPETEHVVEAALRLELPPHPRLLDVGSGSGCLAVTLACELATSRVVALDLSPAALAVTTLNAARLGAGDRVTAIASELVSALRLGAFDLVVSNPPYVAPADADTLSPEIVDYEPHAALFAAGGGLDVIRRLLGGLGGLRPGTPVVVEFGAGQRAEVERLATGSPIDVVEILSDYAGTPRVVVGTRR